MNDQDRTNLIQRVHEFVDCEARRDVESLFEFIDPQLRKSRGDRYEFEPEETMTKLKKYTAEIDRAKLEDVSIEGYAEDGGESRGNLPTAIVVSVIRYNDRPEPKTFRTPWVLNGGQWYSRSLGKIMLPGDLSNSGNT